MLMGLVTAPLRAAAVGSRMALNTTASVAGLAAGTALVAGEAVTSVGQAVADVAPDVGALTRAAMGIAVEALGGPPTRRVSANGPRRWIEVRGLDGVDGAAIGTAVLAAIRATPGVRQAVLNSQASRIVVTIDAGAPSSPELCTVVADAERSATPIVRRPSVTSLPGDDAVLMARTAAAAVATATSPNRKGRPTATRIGQVRSASAQPQRSG